jgi:glutamine amidotransferase
MIVIVDYKTANLGSIVNMFKRVGVPARVTDTPEGLSGASGILLPGIGHFDTCARNLRRAGFVPALEQAALGDGVPLLGICVGAQLLTHGSDEGVEPGLGWIDARTVRFPALDAEDYKVPHMGWNLVTQRLAHPLFAGFEATPRFYFVHSYCIQCERDDAVLATTTHGVSFASGIVKGNVAGVQFHPEKSHRFGMQLLRNFAQATAVASPA